MSLTIINALDDVLLLGVPTYLGLTSDRVILSPGTAAENRYQRGAIVSGQTNTTRIKYTGQDLLFEIVPNPDDSGFQLPEFTNGPEFVIFANALADNYYIKRDFDMVVTSTTTPFALTLIAKNAGAGYTLDTGVNAVIYNDVVGVDTVYATNFNVLTEVYLKQGNEWTKVSEVDATPDAQNNVRIYVQEVLTPFVKESMPIIDVSGLATDRFMQRIEGATLEYYLNYYEEYGSPPVVAAGEEWGTELAPKRAIRLGLPRLEQPNNTAYNDYAVRTTGRKLLRKNVTKRMKGGDVEYMQAYINTAPGNLWWYVNYYFVNGTVQQFGTPLGVQVIDANDPDGVYEVCIPWDDILSGAVGLAIDYIEIYADMKGNSSGTRVTTEKERIYADTVSSEHRHQLLYRNSKGGRQVQTFTGRVVNMREYERVEAQLQGKDDYAVNDAEIFTYNHREVCTYRMSTGMLYADEIAGLDDLANSEEVYILDGSFGESGTYWRPIVIDPGAFSELDGTDGEMESRTFTFTNASINKC